ncbi:MAG: hypothetical protein LCI00_14180 [Chloroflexi bacterium]|nr:hypothetical protein [Chloroflexota bacterium]
MMAMDMMTKVLEMVGENKLSPEQASELLRRMNIDMTINASGKAKFASFANAGGETLNRRVRVIISDSATKQTIFEIANPLDDMLRYIDYFLQLVADNDFESLVLDGDVSPIITELRIETDEQ